MKALIKLILKYRGVTGFIFMLALVAVLVIFSRHLPLFFGKTKMTIKTDTVTVVRIDTIRITSVVYKPYPVNVIYRDTIELPAKIDTV